MYSYSACSSIVECSLSLCLCRLGRLVRAFGTGLIRIDTEPLNPAESPALSSRYWFMGSESVDALADPFESVPAEAANTDVVAGFEASSIKLEMLACTCPVGNDVAMPAPDC